MQRKIAIAELPPLPTPSVRLPFPLSSGYPLCLQRVSRSLFAQPSEICPYGHASRITFGLPETDAIPSRTLGRFVSHVTEDDSLRVSLFVAGKILSLRFSFLPRPIASAWKLHPPEDKGNFRN